MWMTPSPPHTLRQEPYLLLDSGKSCHSLFSGINTFKMEARQQRRNTCLSSNQDRFAQDPKKEDFYSPNLPGILKAGISDFVPFNNQVLFN